MDLATARSSAERGRIAVLIHRQPAWVLAFAIAGALAGAYLIIAPDSADLAAASYRSYLFAGHGLTLWDNNWYGGHYLPAYSLLSPALGAPLGPRLPQAISVVIAAVAFAALIDGRYPVRSSRIACAWFALGAGVELFSGRVPFDIGLALGLGALVAVQRRLRAAALALAVLCSLASPVAGAFLALGCLAWALGGTSAGRGRLRLRRVYASSSSRFIESRGRALTPVGRLFGLLLAAGAMAVIAVAVALFPDGGSEPFAASSFWPAEALVLVLAAVLPSEQRVLRTGALLYGAALAGAFLIPTALGGNAVRLGALVAGPLAACALDAHRRRLLVALAPALVYWQLVAPIRDFAAGERDPAAQSSYYTPLLGELRALSALGSDHPTRIEVIPTRGHWEARWMAPQIALARGWERQLDSDRNALFYDESSTPLTPGRYRAWLGEQAIAYVALPDAPLDFSALGEARLVRSGHLGYLREVWRSTHWRLFAVVGAQPLAERPAVLEKMTGDSFTLMVPAAGSYTVRVRFTPYWALESSHGCVRRGPGGWTDLDARAAGSIGVGIAFSLSRIVDHGPRCR
ncbi:MAG TPA: hypothetical protein VGF15_01685 [Solirubrobacteraceae bacterium]